MTPEGAGARRLHPATLLARWLKIVPQMLAGGIGAAATVARQGFGGMLIFAGVAALVAAGFAFLYWWRFRYTIEANEVVIEKGLFQRQRRVIPFDRVQDIAIEQPLLARLFGTARVKIETGGAAKDEGSLDMIAIGDARALRDLLRRVPRAAGEVAAAEAEAEAPEPVLFEMGLARLLYSGLFAFSLIFLAAISAAGQYLDQLGFIRWQDWIVPLRGRNAASLLTIEATLAIAATLLLLGLVAGVARTVAKDFGFRLTRAQAGLRRKRGLFTLSEAVIPIRRTQVALIESGPIARRLGWYRLSFQTLGADKQEGGVQVAAPFARMEELLPILAEAGFPAPPPRALFQGIPRRALIGQALPYLLLAGITAAAAFAFQPLAGFGAALLVASFVAALLRWRKHGHFVGDDVLFVSKGLLRRQLWIIPFERIQTIIVTRGPIQRRLRLASLLTDSAGASLLRSPIMADLDARDADALADRLMALFLEARARARASRGAGSRGGGSRD